MRSSWPLTLAVAAALPLAAQEEVRRLAPADSNAVVVDVVVRDGKGRPVTDLVAADFEVREDDVPQAIEQFEPARAPAGPGGATEASAGSPPSPTADAPATSDAATGAPTGRDTIAFVFDRLSTEGRVAAEKAVRRYLKDRATSTRGGVFSIEGSLVVLQDFTADSEALLTALDRLSGRVAHAGATAADQNRASTSARVDANQAAARLAAMPTPTNSDSAVGYAQAQIAAKQLSMAQAIDEAFTRLARDEHGFTTAHALTAIVDALRTVPGRKAVVLFSEALFRTEATEERFLSVIHAANRASVSVYAVEAQGLQVASNESGTAAEINSAASASQAIQSSGRDTGGGSMTRSLERTESLVKFNPRASLQWISDATGGTFVRDTNDLEGGLGRIGGELRSYYLLGYTPKNEQWDGRFRRISVRVKRKGVEVRARSGYFAVRSAGPVLAHVAPALAVLESGRKPRGVEVFAGASAFPQGPGPARASVTVTVPGANVARLAAARTKEGLDITLLARVLRADGVPVDSMSRRFVLERGKAPADLLLLRDAWLPAGTYTLEAVAYDGASKQAGTASTQFEVADGTEPLACAQVVIVKGAVPVAGAPVELETGHPLRFGDVILQPLGGEPMARQPRRPFIVQVTAAGASAAPIVTVNVFRGDKSLAATGVRFDPPEPAGFRRHVTEVPMGDLEPGAYELRATLSSGRAERVIRIPFVVAP